MTLIPPSRPARRFSWLALARLVWAALALVIIGLYGLGLADELAQPATLCPAATTAACDEAAAAAQMARLGFPAWYGEFVLVLHDIVIPLGYLGMAVVIFWRARDNWLGVAAPALLAVYALWANTDVLDKLAVQWGGGPGWGVFFSLLDLLTFGALAFLLLTFPDGRFARRWMAAGWVVMTLLLVLTVNNRLLGEPDSAIFLLLLIGGLGYQVYRYRRVFAPAQRQQAKWVLIGLAGFLANAVIWFFFVEAAQQSGAAGVGVVAAFTPVNVLLALSLPAALGISILRYRLWDIDVIIRRTLVYSAVTAALAAMYLASVLVLESLLRLITGQGQSQLVTVISTLGIAAVFVPVRAYLQRTIDRRFYRGKYDAARTLSEFSATARDEVELARLTDDLLRVVEQTMQPERVSLWLKSNTKS
ncbi:MAG: hypothetical protein ABI847_05630 [Anaerolineales bacterium]